MSASCVAGVGLRGLEAGPCVVRLRQDPSAYSPRRKPEDSGPGKSRQAPKGRPVRVCGERPVAPVRGLMAQCGAGIQGLPPLAIGYRPLRGL